MYILGITALHPYLLIIESVTLVLLNPLVRASPDKNTVSHTFKENRSTEMKPNPANVKTTEETFKASRLMARTTGIGQGAFSALSHATPPMLRLRTLLPGRLSRCCLQRG